MLFGDTCLNVLNTKEKAVLQFSQFAKLFLAGQYFSGSIVRKIIGHGFQDSNSRLYSNSVHTASCLAKEVIKYIFHIKMHHSLSNLKSVNTVACQ